ncbi:reverse transcriptase domain-containing protein [Tanacetum coccineum]
MKLNPKKCSFDVEEGPFLGHLITKQGIKANPSKVKPVTNLDQPRTLKDIQSLNEKLAALNRFLSKGAERSLAFFKVLKGCKDKKNIQWTTESDKALEKIKKLVQSLPTLTAPRVGETLTMHLATSKESISVVLAVKRNEGWTPIYFVSRVLQGAELNYPALEKLVLALIPFEDNEKKEKPKEVSDLNSKWRLYTDGASNSDGSGAGLMLIDPEGKEYTYTLRFEFKTTNNKAEYEALLAGLRIAQEMEITKVAIFLDSQLLHIRRNQNKKADALSKLASMTFEHLTKEVLVEVLTKRSIEEKEVLKVDMQERKSWMDPIYEYLLSELLPEDTKEARKIIIQVPQYKLIRGNMEVAKAIQDCEKCKEQSAIRKSGTSEAIAAGSIFRVPWIISSKEEKHFKEGMFADLCRGLKVTQSFSPVTEHMEKMHHIERQLTRSQQGWVDNLAKTLWIHRTLPRNSQKETPFSLTYGSEVVIPIIESTDDRGRVQKATKEKESKEVALIKNSFYQNKLRKYHNARSSHPMYIVGDFVLLKRNANKWQGPYIINEVHKEELYTIVDTTDHSLVQTTKGPSLPFLIASFSLEDIVKRIETLHLTTDN